MPYADPAKRQEYHRLYMKRYRTDPEVKVLEAKRAKVFNQTPARKASHLERWRKKMYGLTLEKYEAMLAKQNHCCAICNDSFLDKKELPHVDHDHVTLKVRALLCGTCNRGLGQFKDSIDRLRKAADYLERFQ